MAYLRLPSLSTHWQLTYILIGNILSTMVFESRDVLPLAGKDPVIEINRKRSSRIRFTVELIDSESLYIIND